MEIRFNNNEVNAHLLKMKILDMERTTRFTIGEVLIRGDKKKHIKIKQIRLKKKKDYCGNHPYACPVTPFSAGQKHAKRNYLEGADWVEFNDRINDILDEMNAAANIKTSVCIVRKGRLRRTEYIGHRQGIYFFNWDMDTDDSYYEDWCGKEAPGSEYPLDTPGLYERANSYASQCEAEAEQHNRSFA